MAASEYSPMGTLDRPPAEPAWTPELLAAPHDAQDKAHRVRRMFNAIAPRYELVNSLFSAGRDRAWRRRAVKLARITPDDVVLDVACGTGDFSRAFAAAGASRVVGCDFAHDMIALAARRDEEGQRTNRDSRSIRRSIHWCEADALRLPFASETFSVVSCAFGVRNFASLETGLGEMRRVLTPGGRLVILEFTRPGNPLFRRLYETYANRIMPAAATLVSGDRSGAYHYLPRSVVSFLTAQQMADRFEAAGFERPEIAPMTLGVVSIYVARRPGLAFDRAEARGSP